jgi:hypothetical protein
MQLYQHEWKLGKTFSVLIYSYISTRMEIGKTQFRVFTFSTSVDITVYQYGKNVLYLFYNIEIKKKYKERNFPSFPC